MYKNIIYKKQYLFTEYNGYKKIWNHIEVLTVAERTNFKVGMINVIQHTDDILLNNLSIL